MKNNLPSVIYNNTTLFDYIKFALYYYYKDYYLYMNKLIENIAQIDNKPKIKIF